MTRYITVLLMALLLATVTNAYSQNETAFGNIAPATSGEAETPKYGPLFQLETKDQAASAGFRDLKIIKKFARRLPNFYSQVVSEAQKEKVYEIQAAYFEPIEMLTLRLERLKAERDAQIEAVLSADQKKKVEALNKESTARRAATRAANANTN